MNVKWAKGDGKNLVGSDGTKLGEMRQLAYIPPANRDKQDLRECVVDEGRKTRNQESKLQAELR